MLTGIGYSVADVPKNILKLFDETDKEIIQETGKYKGKDSIICKMSGLLGGMKGAAEYELLIDTKGSATKGMDAQSSAHALIVLFVIIGNVFYFMGRRREKQGGLV